MSGNVHEYVFGKFLPYEGNKKYTTESYNEDYTNLRGGSFIDAKADSRVSMRWWNFADAQGDENNGFRCAKDK